MRDCLRKSVKTTSLHNFIFVYALLDPVSFNVFTCFKNISFHVLLRHRIFTKLLATQVVNKVLIMKSINFPQHIMDLVIGKNRHFGYFDDWFFVCPRERTDRSSVCACVRIFPCVFFPMWTLSHVGFFGVHFSCEHLWFFQCTIFMSAVFKYRVYQIDWTSRWVPHSKSRTYFCLDIQLWSTLSHIAPPDLRRQSGLTQSAA